MRQKKQHPTVEGSAISLKLVAHLVAEKITQQMSNIADLALHVSNIKIGPQCELVRDFSQIKVDAL